MKLTKPCAPEIFVVCYYVTRGKPIRCEKTKTASGNGVKFVVLWLTRIFLGACSGFRFSNRIRICNKTGNPRTGLMAEKSLLGFLSFRFIEKLEKGFKKLFSRTAVVHLHA